MAYELPIEELQLKNHSVTIDCTIEIDNGGPGDWSIESILIPSFNGKEDLFLDRKHSLFHFIKDSIMDNPKTVAYIDAEAEENNTPSLSHKPSWY
jgi:hypothetical protein